MKKNLSFVLFMFTFLSSVFAAEKIDYLKPIKNVTYSPVKLLPLEAVWKWADKPENFTYKILSNKAKSCAYYKAEDNTNYAITLAEEIPVNPGETYLLTIRAKVISGKLSANYIVRNKNKEAKDWAYSMTQVSPSKEIQTVYSLVSIDSDTGSIQPRLSHWNIGCEAEVYEISLQKVTPKTSVAEAVIENNTLKVSMNTATLACTITDKRNGRIYFQDNSFIPDQYLVESKKGKDFIEVNGFDLSSLCTYVYKVELSKSDSATVDYSLNMLDQAGKLNTKDCTFNADIAFPKEALSQKDDYLVLSVDEGMCIDYDDPVLRETPEWQRIFEAGSGTLSMQFFGITNREDGAGFISIIKTQNDSYVKPVALETNAVGIMWRSQKDTIGYERKLSQTFLTEGNHVAIAKKYREYAEQNGTLVTFEQKRKLRGQEYSKNLDRFFGSANIWAWDSEWPGHDPLKMIGKMKASGMNKILWSHRQSKRVVNELNKMDVLPGHYTIIRDILSEEQLKYRDFPYTNVLDNDGSEMYFPQAHPKDLVIKKDGEIETLWPLEKNDGSGLMYCGIICSSQVEKYQLELIEKEKGHGYGAYFMDCVGTSPLEECYSPNHPMTRTEDRYWKYKQLENASKTSQVVGSETGCDYLVPVCDYFEGMLSFVHYRDEDSGFNVGKTAAKSPSQITKYMLNPKYRLPLWELVYHDCCVAMWYWGDCNTRFTDTIKNRDCYNALYGCPPLYWIHDEAYWEKNNKMIMDSYNRTSIVQKVAGLEMTNHEFLTKDRSVQRTTFADGTQITVDFNKLTITCN